MGRRLVLPTQAAPPPQEERLIAVDRTPLSYLTLSSRLAQAALTSWQAAFLPSRPVQIENFGSDPGNLRMYVYAPPRLRAGRPLVVLLHGCGQTAANFATDAGWIALAQHYRFTLLLPEQLRTNNHLGCFNWFQPGDVRRNAGETLSIRQMIRKAVKKYGSDPRQIFVAGFSAGGGMTAALLAAYSALFAAAGIFAGMPVGAAHNGVGALIKMRRAGIDNERERLAREVMRDNQPRRNWPRVSIWQGGKDRTVDPQNAEVLAAQWSELQATAPSPPRRTRRRPININPGASPKSRPPSSSGRFPPWDTRFPWTRKRTWAAIPAPP